VILTSSYNENQTYLSPQYLSHVDDRLVVSDITGNRIIFCDTSSKKVATTIQLAVTPGETAAGTEQDEILVIAAEPRGKLLFVDIPTGKITSQIKLGHTPSSLVRKGNRVYVGNKFSNNISVVDLDLGKEIARIPVVREPVDLCLSKGGAYLFVANALPLMAGDSDHISASVSVINTQSLKNEKDILLPNGSNGCKGICLSPDGKFVYVTHIIGKFQLPTTQLERGWINTNAVSIIDAEAPSYYNTILLDDFDNGAANPWGIACSGDGGELVVSLAGTHEVCIIDRIDMHKKLEKVHAGAFTSSIVKEPGDVMNDITFLYGMKKRISTQGTGPRGVNIINDRIFTAEYFSGSVGIIQMDQDPMTSRSLTLGKQPEASTARRGELMFHDARICFQQWQSCSSCHPDVRNDGLNWDLLNDGIGNLKNTKSLLYSHYTPPAMILGIRPDAETAVRSGIKYILFAVRPEEDAMAIDAYLKSLIQIPSPYLIKDKFDASARKGKKVFQKAGCALCHTGIYFTDMKKYNVGTGTGREADMQFDTPQLTEVWRTAPYLYDGRALTLKEIFTEFNPQDLHGTTSNLSEVELNDLIMYVNSL